MLHANESFLAVSFRCYFQERQENALFLAKIEADFQKQSWRIGREEERQADVRNNRSFQGWFVSYLLVDESAAWAGGGGSLLYVQSHICL